MPYSVNGRWNTAEAAGGLDVRSLYSLRGRLGRTPASHHYPVPSRGRFGQTGGGTPPSFTWAQGASQGNLVFRIMPTANTPWSVGNNVFLWRSDLPSGTPIAQQQVSATDLANGYTLIADTTGAAMANPGAYTWWGSVTTPSYSQRSGASGQLSGTQVPGGIASPSARGAVGPGAVTVGVRMNYTMLALLAAAGIGGYLFLTRK